MEITDIMEYLGVIVYLAGAMFTTWWCEKRLRGNAEVSREESICSIMIGFCWIISLPVYGILKIREKKHK